MRKEILKSLLLIGLGVALGWNLNRGLSDQPDQTGERERDRRVVGSGRKMAPEGKRNDGRVGSGTRSERETGKEDEAFRETERALAKEAQELAKSWKEKLLGKDRAEVEAMLDELRGHLANGKDPEARAALIALAAVRELKVDRSGLRDLVVAELEKGPVERRKAAYWALYGVSEDGKDLELVYQLKSDGDLKFDVPVLLRYMDPEGLSKTSGDLVGEMIAQAEDTKSRKRIIMGMWGGTISPKLENVLLKATQSEKQEERYAALYWGLSPVNPKSTQVVDGLLTYLSDSDQSSLGRAAWGLQHGVSEEDRSKIARHALEMIGIRKAGPTQYHLEKLLRGLKAEDLPLIRKTLESGDLNENVRKKLQGEERRLGLGEPDEEGR